jgi:hypothetical protein
MTLCPKCGFTLDGPLHRDAYSCRESAIAFAGHRYKPTLYGVVEDSSSFAVFNSGTVLFRVTRIKGRKSWSGRYRVGMLVPILTQDVTYA